MWKNFLSLFLLSRCPLCDRDCEGTICGDCDRTLLSSRFVNPRVYCREDLPLFVWGRYEGKLKRAIALIKYHSQKDLGVYLGEVMGQAWLENNPISKKKKTYLIPIPLHCERLNQRGYNQAELIASGFSRVTGIPVLPSGLVRMNDTQALYKLNPAERRATIKGAFQLGADLKGKSRDISVLLLDDIYTTGTTVKEAALVLKNAGFSLSAVVALSTGKLSD